MNFLDELMRVARETAKLAGRGKAQVILSLPKPHLYGLKDELKHAFSDAILVDSAVDPIHFNPSISVLLYGVTFHLFEKPSDERSK